jgi:acyl-CoA synthetase (AMP-forming)/AMP-acid ligase II
MKVADDTLWIRSARTAECYIGEGRLVGRDGFVDTGDLIELRGDRYYFMGRRGGVINVGGLKVHPEEVEAIINRHPRVHMALVRARRNPVTGAIVVADVVLRPQFAGGDARAESDVENEIRTTCAQNWRHTRFPASSASFRRWPSRQVASWFDPMRNVLVTGATRRRWPRQSLPGSRLAAIGLSPWSAAATNCSMQP